MNRGAAAVLSFFIPGLGQLYKREPFWAIAWFLAVPICYFLIIPGLILHMACIYDALYG